ncbi:MAG: hypothetical protein AB7E72_10610 [Lysobacterales bacterium]
MLSDPWQLLGIDPTRDERAIKRAYAAVLKQTRPEDDPAGFQRLRECRDWALSWARGTVEPDEWMEDESEDADAAEPLPCADTDGLAAALQLDREFHDQMSPPEETAPDPYAGSFPLEAAGLDLPQGTDLREAAAELVAALDEAPDAGKLEQLMMANPLFESLTLRPMIERLLIEQVLARRHLRSETLSLLSERFEWEQIGREQRFPIELLRELDKRLALARARHSLRKARLASLWRADMPRLEVLAWRLLAGDYGRLGRWLSVCIPGLAERAQAILRGLQLQTRSAPTEVLAADAIEYYELMRALRSQVPEVAEDELARLIAILAFAAGLLVPLLRLPVSSFRQLQLAMAVFAVAVFTFFLKTMSRRLTRMLSRPISLLLMFWVQWARRSFGGFVPRALVLGCLGWFATQPSIWPLVLVSLVLLYHRPELFQFTAVAMVLSVRIWDGPAILWLVWPMAVLLLLSTLPWIGLSILSLQAALWATPIGGAWQALLPWKVAMPMLVLTAASAMLTQIVDRIARWLAPQGNTPQHLLLGAAAVWTSMLAANLWLVLG